MIKESNSGWDELEITFYTYEEFTTSKLSGNDFIINSEKISISGKHFDLEGIFVTNYSWAEKDESSHVESDAAE